jgi:hypothetical protein
MIVHTMLVICTLARSLGPAARIGEQVVLSAAPEKAGPFDAGPAHRFVIGRPALTERAIRHDVSGTGAAAGDCHAERTVRHR